jgi:RND superfamily putative drug exporter
MLRLSAFVLRHKALVLLSWLVVLVGGFAAAGAVPGRLSEEFAFPGREGYEANVEILRAYGNGGPGNPLVAVVGLPAGATAGSPGVRRALGAAFERLAADPRLGVRVLAWPATTSDRRLVADGGRTVFALVFPPYAGGQERPELAAPVAAALRPALPPGAELRLTGLDELTAQAAESNAGGTGVLVETLAGALGALLVLAIVFGSLLALVPLLIAAVSILATFLAILGLTTLTEINFLVQFLVALIGLGVAVDYSLLLVTRWREELAAGHGREEAVRRALATAGRAVVLSGCTVAVGLLVLVLLPVPFMRSVGYGGLLIPLAAMAATLTLLPVLLATAGPWLDRVGLRRRRPGAAAGGGRVWSAWAGTVVRRPWAATLAALLLLVPLGAATFGLRLGQPAADTLASTGPARAALARLEQAAVPSGVLTPIEVLVPAGTGPEQVAARLRGVPGVFAATAPEGSGWRPAGTAIVSVLPAAEPGTQAGKATLERVRAAAADLPGVRVGGGGALEADATAAIYGLFPLMLLVVSVATFLMLARAFRSLLLSAKAVVLNLVSIAAAYGVLVLVWQEGYGSEAVWGIPATGAVAMWVPLMTFAFLFGLSMDYEVFLLARTREEYDATGSTREAVVRGLGRVGRLVTSAALILFLAFASLAAVPETDVKILATGLGAGILIDATVLRALLLPALVGLMGRWNWWLPGWAARLLRVPPSPAPHEGPVPTGPGVPLAVARDEVAGR